MDEGKLRETLYPEAEVLRVFKLSKPTLARLRKRGLPFVRFSSRSRAYFWPDLLKCAV